MHKHLIIRDSIKYGATLALVVGFAMTTPSVQAVFQANALQDIGSTPILTAAMINTSICPAAYTCTPVPYLPGCPTGYICALKPVPALDVSAMSCSVYVDANRIPTFTFVGKPTGGNGAYSYTAWNPYGPLAQVPNEKVPGTWGYIQNQNVVDSYLAVTSGTSTSNVKCAYSKYAIKLTSMYEASTTPGQLGTPVSFIVKSSDASSKSTSVKLSFSCPTGVTAPATSAYNADACTTPITMVKGNGVDSNYNYIMIVPFKNKTPSAQLVGVTAQAYNMYGELVTSDKDALNIKPIPALVVPSVNVGITPANPASATFAATLSSAASGSYSYAGVPMLDFGIYTNTAPITIKGLSVSFTMASGTATFGKAYLFNRGTNVTTTADVVNGVAKFTFSQPFVISPDRGTSMTIKVDVANVPMGGVVKISANVNPVSVMAYDVNNDIVLDPSGGAQGSPMYIMAATDASNAPITVSNMATVYGSVAANSNKATTTQAFAFSFSVSAGNYPAFIPSSIGSAILGTTTNISGVLRINGGNLSSPNVSNGDAPNYFYIAPGTTRTFNGSYMAVGYATSTTGVYQAVAIKYGRSATDMTKSISNQDIFNSLKAVLFH